MPYVTIDVNSLYSSLKKKAVQEKVSWRELSKSLGIVPSTFTRIQKGGRPDVDTFAALVSWLGVPASDFMKGERTVQDNVDTLTTVSSFLRADKKLSHEDADALDDVIRSLYTRFASSSDK